MKNVLDILLKIIIGFIILVAIITAPISYLIGLVVLIIGCYSIGYGVCEFVKDIKNRSK